MTTTTREIHLASRPQGTPVADNFRTVETTLEAPAEGQVLVRNTVLSVDPYMRGRMNDVKSYVPPFALDAPLEGGAVGEVGPVVEAGAAVVDHHVGGAEEFRVGNQRGDCWRRYRDRPPRSPPGDSARRAAP